MLKIFLQVLRINNPVVLTMITCYSVCVTSCSLCCSLCVSSRLLIPSVFSLSLRGDNFKPFQMTV